jgi:plastocyanin
MSMRARLAVAIGAFAIVALTPSLSSGALVNIDVTDNAYTPTPATFQVLDVDNENVVWDWGGFMGDTTHKHTVTQKKNLFSSGASKKAGTFELQASAGSYGYFCQVHGASVMKGKVKLVPGASDETPDQFRVFWATTTTTTGNRFAVRYRVDGGPWKTWQKNTRKLAKVFGANDKPVNVDLVDHEYEVSARSAKGKPSKHKQSGWSPPLVEN